MGDVEIHINDGDMMEFFKSAFICDLVKSKADSIAAQANASAHSVMHTPSIDPYASKLVMGEKCAIGLVGAGPIGVALDDKYGCLRSSV